MTRLGKLGGADAPAFTPGGRTDGRALYFSSLRGGYTAIWFLRLDAPT